MNKDVCKSSYENWKKTSTCIKIPVFSTRIDLRVQNGDSKIEKILLIGHDSVCGVRKLN